MTIKERVHSVEETGWDSPAVDMDHPDKPATTEKMILLAYEIGREEATKESPTHTLTCCAKSAREQITVDTIIWPAASSEIPSIFIILTMQAA